MKFRILMVAFCAVALSLFAVACGGDDEDAGSQCPDYLTGLECMTDAECEWDVENEACVAVEGAEGEGEGEGEGEAVENYLPDTDCENAPETDDDGNVQCDYLKCEVVSDMGDDGSAENQCYLNTYVDCMEDCVAENALTKQGECLILALECLDEAGIL